MNGFTEKKNRHFLWINCAKFLAILGVVVDHCKGILYQGETLQYISFFSVTVFFFLSGMTSYYSLKGRKAGESLPNWTGRRLVRILVPYLAAVAVYQYMKSGYTFSLSAFVIWALHFNMEGSFYFVLIYIQLLVAAPALFLLVGACRQGKFTWLWRAVYLFLLWKLSVACVEHTTALETYGGGNYLLGGTFLFAFGAGMVAADVHFSFKRILSAAAGLGVSAVACGASLAFMLKDRFAWDAAFFDYRIKVNPPGYTLLLYSAAVVCVIFCLVSFLEMTGFRPVRRFLHGMGWLGKYTLYVFLYHTLILDMLLPKLPLVGEAPGVVKTAVYLAGMFGLPILAKQLYDWAKGSLLIKAAQKSTN